MRRRRRSLDDLPLILVAAIFWVGTAWRIAETGIHDAFSASLLTAGCIVLGAWLVDYVSGPRDKDE